MAGEPVRIRIEPGSLRKLVQASRTWDSKSRTAMRQNLRDAAAGAVEAVKADVLGSVPGKADQRGTVGRRLHMRAVYGNGHGGSGLRAGLASGVSISIRSGRELGDGTVKGEGVRVSTTGKALDSERQPMVKAYMANTFRHPVFGGPGWANQHGKNWFYSPLRAGRDQYQAAIVAAIEEASQAIAKD